MMPVDWLGTLASVFSTLAFFPQALKVWKHRSTRGISRSMYVLYCLSLLLWTAYAWLIDSWPLLLTEIVTGVMAGYILLMTFKRAD